MDYEDIEEEYVYDDKERKTSVRFFTDKNIATVTEVSEDMTETKVITEGMSLDEIEEYFPPTKSNATKGQTYDLAWLVRSIIYEGFKKEGESMESGNVRHFWYTHLKKIITEKLGLGETDSVLTTINNAWGDLINSGLVTYEGMNIVGGKEQFRVSIVKDSPFSNLIVGLEKADYFVFFKWIPMLFNCTLITAGGQPSRTVARAFIRQLRDLGVDLDQTFYMCIASDLDSAGFYIQEAFRKQFEAAIDYYGGSGKIKIRRLFVRKDQVSKQLLESEAMPCIDKAKKESAAKAEDTKWKYFCEQTGGGIYLPKPNWWKEREVYESDGKRLVRGDGPVHTIDGNEMVRALLEMNVFSKSIIENAIIKELLKIIEETNDESKIMIPEIMRIFELMREEGIDEVYDDWRERLIQPLIDKFLQSTNGWESDIDTKYYDETDEAESERDSAIEPIDEKYDELVEEKNQDARDRVPGLYDLQEKLEEAKRIIQKQLDGIDEQIHIECSDIFEDIDGLESLRDEEKKPHLEVFKSEGEDISAREEYRKARLREFREEHATVFNPLEMMLKTDIQDALSSEDVQCFFRAIEKMERFQRHITRLLTEPERLLESGESCFDHPVPTFTEKNLLIKASEMKDENIERVRNAFPPAFTEEMKDFFKSHVEDVEFSIRGEVEAVDLTGEIREAMEKTEEKVEEGAWRKEDTEEEEP